MKFRAKDAFHLPAGVHAGAWAVAIAGPVILLAAVTLQPWFEARWMFMDVLTAARESEDCCHATFGLVSQLGLFLWVSGAAFALLSTLLILLLNGPPKLSAFMAFGATITAILALDDAFLLHESILPGFGIPQNLVLAVYGVLGMMYAVINRDLILRTAPAFMGLSAMAVGASLAIDVLIEDQSPAIAILEDAFKFLGIALWTAFQAVAGIALVLFVSRTPKANSSV